MVTLLFNLPGIVMNSIVIIDQQMVEIDFLDEFYDQLKFYFEWVFQPLQFSTSIFMLFFLYSDPYV
jgi:hypothetical protein